ncbi:hypothetical protein V8E54_003978 [Elaphomyces granulatus]
MQNSAEENYHLTGTFTRYSSWTARVVTLLEYFQIPYDANFVKLSDVPSASPSGLVPLLRISSPGSSDTFYLNDSLAICEFLAESHPQLPLWPKDRKLRALARCAVAEMHAGFLHVRNCFPSNFVGRYTGNVPVPAPARKEIERILTIWDHSRKVTSETLRGIGERDEGFLFGSFGIADAFFWPVLWRFRTYDLPLSTATREALTWMKTMWDDPILRAVAHSYHKQAERPETSIEKYDDIFRDSDPDIEYGKFEEVWKFTCPQ